MQPDRTYFGFAHILIRHVEASLLRRRTLSGDETPSACVPSNAWTLPAESPASIFTDFENSSDVYSRRKVRETAMKASLSLLFLLLFAASTRAQHSHSFSSSSNYNQGGGYGGGYSGGWDGYGTGGYGAGGYGAGGYGTGGSHHHGGLRYEPPREYSTGYVTNDGPYVPSTFMNYNDALALGQQQLDAAAQPTQPYAGPSLGDVARAYRAARSSTQAPPALVLQDNSLRLRICSLNGDNCRQP
jgi:hypothetical protein